jgi:2-polyprenyl-3-methyl-5-hydroxy-6-metoxy-1,4-benzoquinol methylase
MMNYKGYEYVNCPLCGENDTEDLFIAPVQNFQKGFFSFDEWKIVKCKHCGLIFVNPRISQEVNDNYYRFEIEGDHKFIDHHFIDTAQTQTPYWTRILRLINQQKKQGKLLDIGSGNGAFLVQARLAGFDVEGQDISPYFLNYCKKTYGLKIHEGELSSLHLPSNCFDIVTLFDVIEHHRQPQDLLQEVRRILKPDGIIVISTHDIGNFFARLYGKKWRMIYPIGHLIYYTKQTLANSLKQSGFQIVRIGEANIIDTVWYKEGINSIRSFFTTIFLRTIILYIYKPLSIVFPFIKKIKIKYHGILLSYDLILFKAGNQIISNDEMIIIAQP